MRIFQKLQAVTFAFLLRCGQSEEISSKENSYFKAIWKWKQALQLQPVSRFSMGLFLSQPKRYHFYRRGVSAVLAMALCLSRRRTLPPAWSHAPVSVTTSHQCYGSCTGCQSVSALCSRSWGSCISPLSDWLPRTSQTTVAFCRTLAVAHCGPIPMTFGSCLCHEHITNSVIGVSRPPVLDCGTTFHLDYGGRDLPLTLSDDL